MHEEPYAQAMLDLALEKSNGLTISRIILGVGRFSAIVPDSLAVFFTHLSKGTKAENAELVFEIEPIILTCKICGTQISPKIPMDVPVRPALAKHLAAGCRCGEKQLSVTGGLGLDMLRIEVDA
ncbi:MAG: hydrogenase/urease maturation nickel metallochaperone HypA [Desulfobacterales bacterium]|nr:hydrogenase/urease maturation nickel metallochaperone HypA [Desulfobacterales bacterium]